MIRWRPRTRAIPWAIVFFSCLLLLDAVFGDRGLAQAIKVRQELRLAAANIDRLKRENAFLRDDVRRLQGDPATLEAVARQQLGLIRPGEILVVLKDRQ